MAEAAGDISGVRARQRLNQFADGLAIVTAISLPWSTSATSILVVLWLIALVPILRWSELRQVALTPSGGLPILLVLLLAVGMLWSDVGFIERLRGLEPFLKLVLIPLLFVQFRFSSRGSWVFGGYVVSCVVLMLASYVLALFQHEQASVFFGVPVKNGASQSNEFITCAFGLLYLAHTFMNRRQWLPTCALAILILAMFANVVFVATGRTALVVALALLLVFALTKLKPAGVLILFASAVPVTGVLWFSSPYLRDRTEQIWLDVESFEATHARNSSGERIQFAMKSIAAIRSAPLIGHGTGSIHEEFAAASGVVLDPVQAGTNPHNQSFAVGIQTGVVGIAVLWAMWVAHFLLFRDPGLVAWIGLLLVVQNVVGSLFNSHLSDFVQGWTYVIGVGAAGGIAFRRRAKKADTAQ